MAEHNLTGKLGEQYACRFLEAHGYTVLERNWRKGRHELDIIARTARELVIIEVKTRTSEQHGQPEEAVKKGKRGLLIKGANAYIQDTNCPPPDPIRHHQCDLAPLGQAVHPSHHRRFLPHAP
jgi:putative endonuclease